MVPWVCKLGWVDYKYEACRNELVTEGTSYRPRAMNPFCQYVPATTACADSTIVCQNTLEVLSNGFVGVATKEASLRSFITPRADTFWRLVVGWCDFYFSQRQKEGILRPDEDPDQEDDPLRRDGLKFVLLHPPPFPAQADRFTLSSIVEQMTVQPLNLFRLYLASLQGFIELEPC